MSTLLRHAAVIVTMDDQRREITGGAIYIEGNVIQRAGPTDQLPAEADLVIDCRGMVLLPGPGPQLPGYLPHSPGRDAGGAAVLPG